MTNATDLLFFSSISHCFKTGSKFDK